MPLFERAEIIELLTGLVNRLDQAGQTASIVVVGGAAIEYGDRAATRDVDAARWCA